MSVWIKTVKTYDRIEILGHVFNGLSEIRKAVDASASLSYLTEMRITREKPSVAIEGLHVVEFYKLYPCFDSYDYANEDRFYRNFFFSDKPFSDEEILRLGALECPYNYCMLNKDIPEWAVPAIYYCGEGNEKEEAL